jgi:hypothetical protein
MATPSHRYRWGLFAYALETLKSAKQVIVTTVIMRKLFLFMGYLLFFFSLTLKDVPGSYLVYNLNTDKEIIPAFELYRRIWSLYYKNREGLTGW